MSVTCAAMRFVTSFAVSVAVLLQLWLMPPLMLRMASGLAPFTLCSSDIASSPSRPPGLPVSPHRHDICPLCQSHPAPLGLVLTVTVLIDPAQYWTPAPWSRLASLRPVAAFRLYSPRAPPVPC